MDNKMQDIRELTVIFGINGTIKAAQVRGADGIARVVQAGDIVAHLVGINEAALLCVSELATVEAEYAAFKESATTIAESARAIIADTNVSDADTCARIDVMAANMLRNKRQRSRAAALIKLAEAQTEADKYDEDDLLPVAGIEAIGPEDK